MKLLLILVILTVTSTLNAQIDFMKVKDKDLSPIKIDTLSDSIIIIHKKNAIVYFKQSDIKLYIEKQKDKYPNLNQLLVNKNQSITIKDWWYGYHDGDRKKIFGDSNYTHIDKNYMQELYELGAELIYEGKFMIKDKKTNKIVTKNLRLEQKDGLYGTQYVDFLFGNNKSFWQIITALGE
jgi:hypothetical protein